MTRPPKPRRSAGQAKMRLVHYIDLTPQDYSLMKLYGHITTGSGHGLRAVWEPVTIKCTRARRKQRKGKSK